LHAGRLSKHGLLSRSGVTRLRPRASGWKSLVQTVDFYSMSGCRDMFFNVMENRLTIPDIKAFLDNEGLSFLGFELDPKVIEKFKHQNLGDDALTNLDAWEIFEAANPQTFLNMYVFSICRKGAS
jgi:hypothetical protein